MRRALAPLLLALVGCGSGDDAPRRPNVVLLSVDSWRHDHVSAAGWENGVAPGVRVSPAFDAFAAQGVRFEQAVSTTSWTLPSHVALLTGLPDLLHGVTDNFKRLGDEHVTLAELFRDAGYRTAGLYSGPNLHPAFGFGQGFDAYVDRSYVDLDAAQVEGHELGDLRNVHLASHRAVTSPGLLDAASAILRDAAAADRPFFLFVHWWDPHYDYLAPPDVAERFVDPAYAGSVTGAHSVDKTKRVDDADVRHLRELYDAEIRFTDDHVAKLLALLDDLGIADDTVVVWTADHGEEFYERDRWGHQRTLYDEVVRIPLAVRWPGRVPAGVVARGQARLFDLYPTLAELCDLAAPSWIDGEDLRPLWEDPAHEGFPAPLHLDVPKPTNPVHELGLRTPRAKAVQDLLTGETRVYDLRADPLERRPLDADDEAARAVRDRLRAETERLLAARDALPGGTAEAVLDPELRAQLEAAGYVTTADDAPRNEPNRDEPNHEGPQ